MQTSTGYDVQDPEVQGVLAQLRGHDKVSMTMSAKQYHALSRSPEGDGLPSLPRLYRFFGSWEEIVASLKMPAARSGSRFTDEQLIAAVQYVAEQLGTNVLSAPAYESYITRKAPHLPSASAIRKRLGDWKWSVAMQVCGLKAPDRSSTKPPDPAQIVRALQLASRGRSPMEPLKPLEYNEFCNQHEEDELPELMQILEAYGTWEHALHMANIELEDDMHPSGWTIHEARSALQAVQRFTGRPVTRSSYERTRARAKRIASMPMWQDLLDTLALEETPSGKVVMRPYVAPAGRRR
jgi:hypothetical protein